MDLVVPIPHTIIAHRAPDPAPGDQPLPEPPHVPLPVPQDDPVPDHHPSLAIH